jgi:2-polyprenyl-6-hydroxyphenyl methylase/3-demethylubiquinone-9 3-methyltransferase
MPKTDAPDVNNEIYHRLGERWYTAQDDPVALLRAEAALRNPWMISEIERNHGKGVPVLDIGCGGGFLTNALAAAGFEVTGIDQSVESLGVARAYDKTGTVRYDEGSAYELPYPAASFDAVCAMDFLEHVDEPARVVAEAARVLKPGGTFFASTFNRNRLSWFIVIKGVEWFVKNTPPNMHVLHLFITPEELAKACTDNGLRVVRERGMRPKPNAAFFKMLLTRVVPKELVFEFTESLRTGYLTVARKD